jgi:hypothetical protein
MSIAKDCQRYAVRCLQVARTTVDPRLKTFLVEMAQGWQRLAERETHARNLFKKPFTLSDKVEFMVGAGPQWGNAIGGATKAGVEFALDFFFWPTPDRKFGWFLEPSYSYTFVGGHEQSLGVNVGLFIPIYENHADRRQK